MLSKLPKPIRLRRTLLPLLKIQSQSRPLSSHLDSPTISKVTAKEKEITGLDGPVAGGPTARAQQHANEPIASRVLHDITEGEKVVTGRTRTMKGGPTAEVQSELAKAIRTGEVVPPSRGVQSPKRDPILDPSNIAKIHAAEQKFTEDLETLGVTPVGAVVDGPTVAAQRHAGERIDGRVLHDITEGEKHLTGLNRPVKGGPSSVAQSIVGKSRNQR
ncbi:hypothetical protein TWF694_006828 [Orbilia ellipsospora]|uniref:SMP domain-containing protein n=1 Tax=Orbilia ellipsospora TaxID=2528407 RepID=A0AAV9XL86_9PEZI